MTIKIEDLTLGQLREAAALIARLEGTQTTAGAPTPAGTGKSDYPIGHSVIVRTVTMIYTGSLLRVTEDSFVLGSCSWIPETERYSEFVSKGSVRECEPYPEDLEVFVQRGSVVDLCELRAPLPRKLK